MIYVGTNNQSYLNNGNDSHALLVSLTKTTGKHTIIAGVDGRMHYINFFNVLAATGTYNFSAAQTQGPNAAVGGTNDGNAYASFLLGAGSGGNLPIGSGVEMKDMYGAVYVEDNWRVTERLTANLGVRYDGESPYDDRHDRLNYFDPNVASRRILVLARPRLGMPRTMGVLTQPTCFATRFHRGSLHLPEVPSGPPLS